jgi:hypothetical protein
MKKPTLQIREQQPKNTQRADIAPAGGFALVVDGHFKTPFESDAAAQKPRKNCLGTIQCCKLKYTMLRRKVERWSSNNPERFALIIPATQRSASAGRFS